ncbi:MAG: hypothetical protein K4571_00845 [Deltaproteobacteria bacterium]
MKRCLKRGVNESTKAVMFVFILAALLLFSPYIASAYTVQVTNTTNGRVNVNLYTSRFIGNTLFESVHIEPGQSYTFHTQAKCPCKLSGAAQTPDRWWALILDIGCAGLLEGDRAGGICCWDLRFQVIYQDGIYRFKKV